MFKRKGQIAQMTYYACLTLEGRKDFSSFYSKTRQWWEKNTKRKHSLWSLNTTKTRLTEVSRKMLRHGYKGVRT